MKRENKSRRKTELKKIMGNGKMSENYMKTLNARKRNFKISGDFHFQQRGNNRGWM